MPRKLVSDVGYPKGPCKVPYVMDPFASSEYATLANIKSICDSAGIQIQITLKPTSMKLQFIKVKDDGSIKNRTFTFLNDNLANFTYANFMHMVMDITSNF